ncbi:TonB-dependent receptor [Porphyrobacter sp. LM 6]|uniref:TonB-dependent receptor n=1 Tax=Porphyrobacter sp. LM 6 TaxID=1896196 RepID=UPI00086384FE|nr:TonB-dependent receptor [Porphyrobacter sp. LM 6]AOL95698.1 TonB-dependent receptor [Porphyrobacter sp. LM 6]
MKQHLVASGSKLALVAGALGLACSAASAQDSAPQSPETPAAEVADAATDNVIVVSGVRQSIESAIDDKRRASEIKDVINAEDIGQLANDNISEALQRITGVQVNRGNDGEGRQVQVRGLSENNVTVNGAIASGTGDVDLSNGNDRSVNFQDLPAELFAGVEILKALTADQIEGSLGGTINLQTRAPLSGKRDLILNLSGTAKRAEVGDINRQDGNLFLQKKFLDTPLGDFGVIVNLGYKEIASYAYVYGGNEVIDAPGIWTRRIGNVDAPPSQGTNQTALNYNFFQLATIPNATGGGSRPNPYRYAVDDPNGDGLSDANDVYYIPGAFGVSERVRDDTRKSFNGTLQWKPASNLDIRFDAVLTDLNESLTGANMNIVSNIPRSGILVGGPGATFEQLGTSAGFGDVYVLTGGRLASFTTRVGAAPSINEIARESQQFSAEATWDATDSLTLHAKATTSRGTANTLDFGQLSASIEQQGGTNPRFNNQDFYNFVDYQRGDNLIPLVTFYENPFPSSAYGVNSVVDEANLVTLNPGDLSYRRYRYRQFQRNAADTENTDDSIRFDATWEPDMGFFESFQAGFRWAERSFERARYENPNEGGGVTAVLGQGVRDPVQSINIWAVPLNPANTTDPGAAATATFLSSCLTTAGNPDILARYGGNLPMTFGSTAGCDVTGVANYFNLFDIRAVDPAAGSGFYEVEDERFRVTEQTMAGYLRANFRTDLGSVAMFGNVGLRYVETKTTSSGYLINPGTPTSYSIVTFNNTYDDWLPSANVNFGLSKDLVARVAYSRTLGRPALTQISPGLELTRSDVDPDFAGFGVAGNPFLNPVHSDNFDTSLEWYYDKGSYLSVAAFIKNIDTTIFRDPVPTSRDINGEVFSVTTFGNFGGTKLKGIELGAAHAFTYLPGLLRHLGITGNFTYIDETSDLRDQEGDPIGRRGLSKYTYNAGAFYDDKKINLRLAYNWRSAFTRREIVQLGFARPEALPEIEAARGQLDFAARVNVNRNLRFTLDAVNLTNTGTFRYLKYEQLVNYVSLAGRRFNVGVAVSF